MAAEAVDEQLAGEVPAVAAPGLKADGTMAEMGQPGVDAAFLHQASVRQLRQEQGNMTARQFMRRVAKHLFSSPAAVADHAQVVEREHHQVDRFSIGNAG